MPAAQFTLDEAAQRAGVDVEVARRSLRAVGLADREPQVPYLDERDVEGLRAFKALLDMGTPLDEMVAMGRAYGQAMSRLGDAEASIFRKYFLRPLLESGARPDQVAGVIEPIGENVLRMTDALLHNARRTHLATALREAAATGVRGGTERLAVAFVDLVGFSGLSGSLEDQSLSELVTAFEDLAGGACVDTGARMVKVIGDAVMLVSTQPERVLAAARHVVQGARHHAHLPAARAGIDIGETITLAGDYFGEPVNIAARMTAFAEPDSLAVSRAFKDAINDDNATPLGRHALKGVGEVEIFRIAVSS
jgi:adenylate cyclase